MSESPGFFDDPPPLNARAAELYAAAPEDAKDDLAAALDWARKTLTNHEGAGHQFQVVPAADGRLVCAFAKPEWSGDHASAPMPTASEAVVRAVCEYMGGM